MTCRLQCTEGSAKAALQGISPRGNMGDAYSGEIWASEGDAQQQGVKSALPAQELAVGRRSPLQK